MSGGGSGSEEGSDDRLEPDAERVALLREVADDVRGDSAESERIAAILYRVSDLYDPAEDAATADVYRNVRNVLRIAERGTLARERDDRNDRNDRDDRDD